MSVTAVGEWNIADFNFILLFKVNSSGSEDGKRVPYLDSLEQQAGIIVSNNIILYIENTRCGFDDVHNDIDLDDSVSISTTKSTNSYWEVLASSPSEN